MILVLSDWIKVLITFNGEQILNVMFTIIFIYIVWYHNVCVMFVPCTGLSDILWLAATEHIQANSVSFNIVIFSAMHYDLYFPQLVSDSPP